LPPYLTQMRARGTQVVGAREKMAVVVQPVTPQLLAAVQARVPIGGIAQAFRASLDQVWAFLRRHPGLRTDGHNVFLYHHDASSAPGATVTVDFGVQVTRAFVGEGPVRCVETPAGEVATMVHHGPYERMGVTHAAVQKWCADNNRRIGDRSWEIYGDWSDDPAKLETTICYLLALH